MHVKIDQDMRVSYNGTLQDLKRDQVVDGPLARWLAEESGCPVTVLDDPQAENEDAGETEGKTEGEGETEGKTEGEGETEGGENPAADGENGPEETPEGDPAGDQEPAEDADGQEAEQDGALAADLTATSTAAAAPKPTAGKSGAKGK